MPASTFAFFHEFKKYWGDGTIIPSHTFKVYLSNDAPVVGTDTVKADVTAITEQNGYTEWTPTITWEETGSGTGVWRLKFDADKEWTSSGAGFGPFRYAVLYDDTPSGTPTDPLVGYWDYGSAITPTSGEKFKLDLDANFAVFEM
jgi:hypothetical protein